MNLLQIYQRVCQRKNVENRLTFGEVMSKSLMSCFLTHCVCCVHIYAKIQNFILLYLTLTKLFHIKRDHLGIFTFHLKNTKNAIYQLQLDRRPISTKFNVITQNESLEWLAVKNFSVEIPRWRTATMLKIDNLQYLAVERVSRAYRLSTHLGFLKWAAHLRHVLHHRAKLCGDRSYCHRDIPFSSEL